jgi:XTP/dITP diphosphohydrolase
MLKNKIIKLLVGTNNKGKLNEIKNLLPKNLEIYTPQYFKIKSPLENGKTFEENSLIKAKFFSKKSKMTCLSDDSGLEIDALNGNPGIYSARWGGKKGDFKKAMNRVLKN